MDGPTIQTIRRAHLPGVMALCAAEGFGSYAEDAEGTWRALTNPGVTTLVAAREGAGAATHGGGVRPGRRQAGVLAGAAAEAFHARFVHRRKPGFRLYPDPPG